MATTIRRRLTFSNVLAVIALFIALGGSAYAANKLSGKTIKKNSEPGNRLKNDSVTGKKINEGSLDTVPSATTASTAKNVFAVSVTGAGNVQTATLSGTTAKHLSVTGDYSVTFPRSLQGCVATGSPLFSGEVGAQAGAFGANTVEVITNNSAGAPADLAFGLNVTC